MRVTHTTVNIYFNGNTPTAYTDEIITKCIIHEEISLISDQLAPKTCEFSLYLDPAEWGQTSPKLKRSLKVTVTVHLIDDVYGIDEVKPMGTFFVDSWEREINNISTIRSVGYLSILGSKNARGSSMYVPPNVTPIPGYGQVHRTVGEWFQTFFAQSGGAEYELDPSFTNVSMVGTLPHTNMKDYLGRVAFRIGAVVEEDRSGKFLIYPQEKISTFEIEEDRIIPPCKETKNNPISTLKIETYSYTVPVEQTETDVIFSGYLSTSDKVIYFDQPIALFETPPSGITYTGGNVWYKNITVSISGSYTLKGIPYREDKNSKIVQSTATTAENSIDIGGNQLITYYNVNSLSRKILETYQFYISTLEFKYISNGEEVGWFGSFQIDRVREAVGTIVSQDIDVSGGLITTAKAQISGFKSLLNRFTCQSSYTGVGFGLI